MKRELYVLSQITYSDNLLRRLMLELVDWCWYWCWPWILWIPWNSRISRTKRSRHSTKCKFPYLNAIPVSGAFSTLQGRVAFPALQPISIDSRTDRPQHPGKLWLITTQRTVTYRVYVDGGLGGRVRRFRRVTSPLQSPPPDNP